MTESVAVIVATFGDEHHWNKIARRAISSIENQTRPPDEFIRIHSDTLQNARNEGAARTSADWLIFCDADDELADNYIEKMLQGSGDIRQPSTLGIVNGKPDRDPYLIPEKPLLTGNFIVIGAMINAEIFKKVGGFDDYQVYEDWALWLKMWIEGDAKIGKCPEAVYKVHIDRKKGRNHSLTPKDRDHIQHQIEARFLPAARKKGLR